MELYTEKMQQAIRFMVKTHEVYQKQKRKGKDIPYLMHPLTVGLILARAGASEDTVIAGILHDTIEDSLPEKPVTAAMLQERFGVRVAQLVSSVTELSKDVPWDERKREALEHIDSFDHDSILVKSADVIANNSETLEDYAAKGEEAFGHFSQSKEKTIGNTLEVIEKLRAAWPQNPLESTLALVAKKLSVIE